jgi:hypothetical protein
MKRQWEHTMPPISGSEQSGIPKVIFNSMAMCVDEPGGKIYSIEGTC